MLRSEFNTNLDEIAGLIQGGNMTNAKQHANFLLGEVLATRGAWPRKAFLDMAYGGHGEQMSRLAARSLVEGLSSHRFGCSSFARVCLMYHKIDLLRVVVERGFPASMSLDTSPVVQSVVQALESSPRTTAEGRILDLMAGSSGVTVIDGAPADPSFGRFLATIDQVSTFGLRSLDVAAKLLGELDPDHRDAHLLRGSARTAFTQALMLKRIDCAALADPAVSVPPPTARPTPRRAL